MRALIRFLTRAPGGAIETRERVFEGDALTLGRATDQVLQFKDRRVAFQHARVYRRDERIVLSCRSPATIVINEALVRDVELSLGDVLRLGANILTIVAPPAGIDVALTFELDPSVAGSDVEAVDPRLRLRSVRLGKRGWSWLLFLGILAAFLVVPFVMLSGKASLEGLRAGPLPCDHAWSTGALHEAHRTIGGRCDACHQRPFVRVENQACLACHGPALHRHASPGIAVGADPDSARCERCHSSHEPALLTRRDDALCTPCHADLKAVTAGRSTTGDATDFGTRHPQFRVTLQVEGASGDADRLRRVPVDSPTLREKSHLKFGHAQHLDPRGLKTQDGTRVLGCGDCHRPQPGGARMQPIVMTEHCQGCHRLDFDPAFPDRQLPHGDVAGVLNTLLEYYSARYLEGWPDPAARGPGVRFTATPGPALAAAERERRLGIAKARTQIVARDLFARRACSVCHEVRQTPDAVVPWEVTPVHLAQAWFPAASFDHSRHGTTLTACTRCHAAQRSTQADDVLMPGIESCQRCHAGSASSTSGKVASGCPACHVFHDSRRGRWVVPPAAPGRAP